MKRKLIALLTAMLLTVALATPAFADLIWEPYGDAFYERHRDEITYHDRAYITNGAEGYVTVRTSPDSFTEVVNLSNGTRFFVIHVWEDKDGTQWGIGYPAGMFDYKGWVRLSDMAMVYDYICFNEDHGGEFRDYDGSEDHLTEAYVYTYPGGVVKSKLEQGSGDYRFTDSFQNLYTDENGLRWTFISYYMGHRDGWVCIDDPMNETLGTDTYLTVGQVREGSALMTPSESDIVSTDDQEPGQNTEVLYPPAENVPAARIWWVWVIPAVLVIAVVVVTALIVRKRRKKA